MRIAFIGAVGLPNRYGGFEAFLEACAPELVKRGHDVLVTCDARRYDNKEPFWAGVRRCFVGVPANGALSVLHDLIAFFTVVWRSDAVVILGVSGGLWAPLMRLLCEAFRVRLIVNIDGVEWRRKSSLARNAFLYLSDRCAQVCSHVVVFDNAALLPYVVPFKRKSAKLIAYPGDHVRRSGTISPRLREAGGAECLTICRIEPENNCHLLLEAAARACVPAYVFVGNWDASEYGRVLRKKYSGVPGFSLLDPTYDQETVGRLREACTLYLHGHSVGGTNPSLVEMLFYECSIAAYECSFNRHTAGDAAVYFSTIEDLVGILAAAPCRMAHSRDATRRGYLRERISELYEEALGESRQSERADAAGLSGNVQAD